MATELVKVVALKLADEAFKMYVRSQGIDGELENLERELLRIQAVLKDASDKEIKDEAVKQWLNDLQHLAYDIDDVLDDVAIEAMHLKLTQESGASTSKVRKFTPTCCTKLSLSHRLSSKLDSLITELGRLEKQKVGLGLIIQKDEKLKTTSRRNETSLPDVSSVVGRKGEIEELRNKLLRDEPTKQNFSIVPIIGMGGVCKTTLARLLFNDQQVKDHFELKAWVCVSDDFDIFKISDTIFQYEAIANKENNKEFKDLNQLQMALGEQFKGKRFLLVVDDVWTDNYDDWENLVRPFHSCAHGSRIIMTTRKDQLLIKLGFNNLDRIEKLSLEDALSLFALHALGVDNFDSHTTLKQHGESFVKKCDCLPLAIKAIGRLLRTKTYGEDWNGVLNSEIWDIENGKDIIPALRLSYHDLSADLKQLFAYCSLFPKDFLFKKEDLVLLWMAEGFLNPSSTTKSPEILGNEYFEILLSRSFFQHAPNEGSLFMMHDLMVDLATFIAGEFFLRCENHMKMGKEVLAKHRYMSFTHEEYVGYHKFEEFKKARSLRTMLTVFVGVDQRWNQFYLSNKILVDLLPKLPLLRVLSLTRFEINEVPECIGNLKHLRYLNLSQTNIKELPDNVGNLYNLETLIVNGCRKLTKLPKSFLRLKNLRHFKIHDTPLLTKLLFGINELKNLQSLTKIIIEGDDGFSITELKGLKNIHGIVSIEGLHKVQSPMHARAADLFNKGITRLMLKWDDVFDGSRRGTIEKEVLKELKPNSDTLELLAISSYEGIEFPKWVGDPSFHRLETMYIVGCRKCTSLPSLGLLPSLKVMHIKGMNEVKYISLELARSDVVIFPLLKVLVFENMLGWEAWSTYNKIVFTCLVMLNIKNCPNLMHVSLEALPSLRDLTIDGCGDSVLRSLVEAAPSIINLEISSISGLTDEIWRGVIKYLGLVEKISIKECNEIRYLWESEAHASKVLVNLKKLVLWSCDNLVSLGEKEEEDYLGSNLLSSLMVLEILSCKKMERCCCPNSIKSLSISCCESFTRLFFPTITTQGGGQKLKSLKLFGCEKLMERIDNTSMPMLEVLNIYNWKNLKSVIQLSNFIHLTELTIQNCSSIKSFSDLQLSNLTRLSIKECYNLESFLELSNLTLLEHLRIINCPSVDNSFPCEHWPPGLCSLEIGALKKPISEWGLQYLPASLVELTLYREHEVSNFSQLSNMFPSSLTKLTIEFCDNLKSLSTGLQHLTSLQHLTIGYCEKIKHLPKTLLPSLLSLVIDDCPKLKKRCNGRSSHYWPLISHIPYISID